MTEWYVLIIGKPKKVILGRVYAVREAMELGHPTRDERLRASRFLESPLCNVSEGLRFAGKLDPKTGYMDPDIELIRVVGPGSEI